MKTIKDFNLKNKRVLLRCDFNVPLNEKGEIENDFRIKQSIPTIKYLVKNKAKIFLISHLSSPGGEFSQKLKLDPVQKKLEQELNQPVAKADDCIGEEAEKKIKKLKEGEILLLENLRFHKGEEKNDLDFAKELAKFKDIYINDAFGVCHRKHASVVAICRYLAGGAGFLLEKELKILSRILKNPWRPLVVIIGGAKVLTRVKMIKKFSKSADYLLIGGKIADNILNVKGVSIGKPWPEEQEVKEIEKLDLTSPNIHFPIDVVVSPDHSGKAYIRNSAPAKARKDEMVLDIGLETVKVFSKIIKEAKMVVWSGPLGYFENPLFAKGTREIAEKIVRNYKAYKIVGGGDTLSAVDRFKLRDKFDHVSTGGAAMLAFLGGEKLPGIEALNNEKGNKKLKKSI